MTAIDYSTALSSVARDELARRRLLDFAQPIHCLDGNRHTRAGAHTCKPRLRSPNARTRIMAVKRQSLGANGYLLPQSC